MFHIGLVIVHIGLVIVHIGLAIVHIGLVILWISTQKVHIDDILRHESVKPLFAFQIRLKAGIFVRTFIPESSSLEKMYESKYRYQLFSCHG